MPSERDRRQGPYGGDIIIMLSSTPATRSLGAPAKGILGLGLGKNHGNVGNHVNFGRSASPPLHR
jgi:hypothetical protein